MITPDLATQWPVDPIQEALEASRAQQDHEAALMLALQRRQEQSQAQGWGGPTIMPNRPGPINQNTIANTAGYAGPLRPSDVPSSVVTPVMPARQAMEEDQTNRLKAGAPPQLRQLLEIVSQLRGVPPAVLERLGGVDRQGEQLARQKDLAKYTHELTADDRKNKLEMEQKQLDALIKRYDALTAQANATNQIRLQNVRPEPTVPFKSALEEVEAAARSGMSQPELQALIESLGYRPTGSSKRTGGWFGTGMGGTEVPTFGLQPRPQAIPGAAPQAQPGAAPQASGPKKLTREIKAAFLQAAGGDIAKAKKMAQDQGYTE
jgi:hypothetical protein